jgi:hypothetical protein
VQRLGSCIAVGACAAAWALAGSPAVAQAQLGCLGDLPGSTPPPAETDERLTFGIFPGGPAGVIAGPRPPAVPEDQGKIDAALGELAGGRPFVVHQYIEYTTPAGDEQQIAGAEAITDYYASRGLRVEWVLRYRPAAPPDVAGYVSFVREAVRRLGDHGAVKAIQVTNEANFTAAPDAADGAYAGAADALVEGVIAAKDEAISRGLSELEIGFNWFYRTDPASEQGFWSGLGTRGGERFAAAVDWVGLDAYPETFFPPVNTSRRGSMTNAMSVLRECFMPLAGLGGSVPIHVTENGWPTAPNRSYAEQERALREMVLAVHDYRAVYNVTDYRWFTLRDSNSSDPNFQQQYGIMRDDYTPKPAFWAYRELIAALGVGAAGPPGAACSVEISGTPKRDRLEGSAGGDRIHGAAGRDRLRGHAGDDCMSGGRGHDRVGGGAGHDELIGGAGRDRLAGGADADRIAARGGGADAVRCGSGHDTAIVDRRDRTRGCERVSRAYP